MKASVHTFLFSVLAAGLLFSSCSEEKEKQEEIPASNFRAEVSATPVRTAVSERRSFDYLINATGKVDALEEVLVVVERAGFLNELRVKEGDRVTKGQVLATLAPEEAAFKVEKAKIALRNAQAKYESELLNFERIMEGEDEERKAFIQEQLKANSGVLIAEIELKEAERDFEKGEIVAPISGQVANVKLKQGAVASAGAELLEIVNTNSLELKVKVLESDISLLSLNQEAEIYPVSGGEMRVGTLRSLNPKVDENGLVQVGVLIRNPGTLLPGMNARAVIRAPQNNSLVVPKQALVYRSGRAVVFTIENNESKWNYVEVGKDNGREVEILSGIEEDMTVITSNNLQLAHQAPVQVVND